MSRFVENTFQDTATFGFELEFLVAFKEHGTPASWIFKDGEDPSQIQRPFPEEPYDLERTGSEHELHMRRLHYFGTQIAETLTGAGVATNYRKKGHPNDDSVPGLKVNDAKLGRFDKFCYEAYKATTVVPEETMIWTDPTVNRQRMLVRPESQQGYFWLGFEVVSHAYRHQDFQSAEEDLETICTVLREKYMVSVNAGRDSDMGSSRCATHIHWGLSGRPYQLLHIKRLLTLLWIIEEDLMGLHATWRQSACKYAALLRERTNMAMEQAEALPGWLNDVNARAPALWRDEMEMNVPHRVWESLHRGKPKIQWLWRADGMEDLAKLVGESKTSRRAAIAITELLPADFTFSGKVRKSRLNTVEFRHMQSSLCPKLVAAWIEVTGKVVEICVRYSAKEFKNLLEEVASCNTNKTATAYNFLDILRVGQSLSSVFKGHNQKRLDEESDSDRRLFLPPLDYSFH